MIYPPPDIPVTQILVQLVLATVMIGAGILAHELVHYLSALPFSEEVRFVRPAPTKLAVEYDYHDEDWRHRAGDVANLMPLILGLTAIILVFFMSGLPPFELGSAFIYSGFIAFVSGGRADYLRVFV
jgi:hypothetical protein